MDTNSWFETTSVIDQMQDDGMTKAVTQKHLVDAMSFKEAEERIIKELAPFTSGTLEVKAVKKVKINELFGGIGEVWYKVKIMIVTIDEKTQAEKETPNYFMVSASSFDSACDVFKDGMRGSLVDYRIVKVEETKILDVYLYQAK